MKALAMFVTIFCCLVAFPAMGNDVISGKVIDSITGRPISVATVKINAPAESTLTDTAGNYSLTVITTELKAPAPMISNRENFRVEVFSLTGIQNRTSSSLPAGVYLARISAGGQTNVCRILNVNSGSVAFKSKAGNSLSLAKSAVASYTLNFSAAGYTPASRIVTGSVTGLNQLLKPLGSNANINIHVNPMDTLTITTRYN